MIWTTFASLKDTAGQQLDLSWQALAQRLLTHKRQASKGGGLYLPGTLQPGTSRQAKNVAQLHALVLDLDHASADQIQVALQALLRYTWVYYSTHSSTAEQPRGRVVLPLAQPLGPEEYRRLWQAAGALIGGVQDQAAKDVSRIYYWPTCPPEAEPDALANDGELLSLASLPAPQAAQLPAVVVTRPMPSGAVVRTVRALARQSKDPVACEQWEAVLRGEPFAMFGNRHDALLGLTFALARQLPDGDPAALAQVFAQSLDAMQEQAGAPTLQDAVTMLKGAQTKLATQQAQVDQRTTQAQVRKIQFARQDGNQAPYTPEELAAIATTQGCSVEDLSQRWICYISGSYYLLTLRGYVGPFLTDIRCLAETLLAPAQLRLTSRTTTGQLRLLPLDELLRVHGTPALGIVADLTAEASYLDSATQILHEATARRTAYLEPVRHEDVHQWLVTLGGAYADRLLDWVAVLPQLDKTCCGLYLYGESGTGKTLLAHGASQLWGDGVPTDISEAFATFNERLAKNPLVLADEYIPTRPGESVTGQLRQLIGSQSFTIRRKHKVTVELLGNLRVIFTSNETGLFEFDDAVGRLSQEALAKRILYLAVAPSAADYLRTIKPERLHQWRRRAIAEHALWLAANRNVTPGRRLYVEGDLGMMLRRLNVGNRSTSLVCEWLVRYLLDPQKTDMQEQGLVRVDSGRLWVNNQAVVKHWTVYHEHERPLSTHRVGKALGALAESGAPHHLTVKIPGRGETRLRFWEIDLEQLVEWSETNNWCTAEELRARVAERHDGVVPEEEPF